MSRPMGEVMTYTKGPWRALWSERNQRTRTGKWIIYSDALENVGEVGGETNARLIALAPDLVEALRAAHLALMGCKAETIAEPERRRIVGAIGELLRRVEGKP